MNNVTVICNVEHVIEVGVCALCQRDEYAKLIEQVRQLQAEIERLRKALQNLVHHVNLTWPEDCTPISDAVDAAVAVLGKP